MYKEIDSLDKHIEQPIPHGVNIAAGSIAIPFFGDLEKAKVVTLSVNPDYKSLYNPILSREHFGLSDDEPLSDEMVRKVYDECRNYFKGRKGDARMKKFEKIEKDVFCGEFSYEKGEIAHMHIVPWATDPHWNQLKKGVKADLLGGHSCLSEIQKEITGSGVKILYLDGKTACEIVFGSPWIDIQSPVIKGALLPDEARAVDIYLGRIGECKVIGCSEHSSRMTRKGRIILKGCMNEALKECGL